jgi:UDP-GlcNAc:undecaprenyl-phosphate GlcNAc-1-phosphate transferase
MPFLIAFGVSLVLAPLAGRVAGWLGLVDRPGDDLKIHVREVPTLGGVAVVAGVAAATLAPGVSWPEGGVVAAVVIAMIVGTVDDVRPLPPIVRVGGLGVAGVALVMGTGFADLGPAVGIGIVLLVLACANAVNILDGQDGLAAGVAAVAALGLAACLWLGVGMVGLVPLALGGALVGFVVWNRPPARIYLGDGGAYAVGVLLALPAAVLAVAEGWRGLLAAGACLAVPAFEVVFTVARRAAARESLSAGDRSHSYDLVSARWGRGRSTAAFIGLALVGAAFGVVITILPLPAGIALALGGVGVAALWGVRLWARRSITT